MLLILFLILGGLLYLFLVYKQNYWKHRNVPHRKPNLIFGNLFDLTINAIPFGKYFEQLYNEFSGPYFGFYAYTDPWLVVKDPNLIKRILIQDSHVFPNHNFVCDEKIDSLISNGLFALRAPKWRLLRTKLSPVFTSGKIKAMFHLLAECGDNLIGYMSSHLNESLEVKEMAAKYSTDGITSCAFGISANSFLNENSEFRVAGRKLFPNTRITAFTTGCYFLAPVLVKLFRFKFINEDAAQFLRKAFNETISLRERSKTRRNDLIDTLIELKNAETTDDEYKLYGDRLLAQAVTFFGAGLETTSSAIAFTLHELCVSKTIQERLRKNVKETIEKYGGLSYEAVQDMKYLHMIICETLRKYPLTPFLTRRCVEDYTVIETGFTIEKGTPIMISQNGLHWDPKYFPNPEVFDPERFSPENIEARTKYVYMPFGDGPRSCIGERFGLLSVKLGIIQIIRNFQIEKSVDTREPLVFGPAGLLQAIPGVFVSFKRWSTD